MIWLTLGLGLALADDDAVLAVERAKAALLEEQYEEALHQATIATQLDGGAWPALQVYLDACQATGVLERCEGEFRGFALEDPIAATVLTWHRVDRGAEPASSLASLDGQDADLTVLALADLALRDGSYPVVDVMLDDVSDPFGETLRIQSLMDRELYSDASRVARAAALAHPDHPEIAARLVESRERGVRRAKKAISKDLRATASTTLDPVLLWRIRQVALASGEAEFIGHIDENLRRVGELPGLARLAWSPVMRKRLARTLSLTRSPELPVATPSETRDLAAHIAVVFRDMGRIPEALAIYEAARDRSDSSALAADHANQLLRTRNYEAAKVVAEESLALALRPSSEDLGRMHTPEWRAEVGFAYATLATAEAGLGDKEAALEHITTATLLAPSADWFALRGMLQNQEGYSDAAFTSFAIAHSLGSPSLEAMSSNWRGAGDPVDAAMAIAEHWAVTQQGQTVPLTDELDPEARETRQRPRVGVPFPEWSVEVGDVTVDSASTEGEVVVLSFWASWCGPCREELPALDRIAARVKEEGLPVRFIAISTDEQGRDYERYLEKYPLKTVSTALNRDLAQRLSIRSIPTTWVIGPDGRARHKHLGYTPGSEARLETEVRELATSE
ncbi:MAG: TlpA family protein disulfide reductase [Proteobacteria bacterium]|nr:TlpA family protein disulfide reductase [Pseudomonadota bacterium]